MVLDEQQHVLALAEPEQVHPGQLAAGEVEGSLDFLAHPVRHLLFTRLQLQLAEVLVLQGKTAVRKNLLLATALRVAHEARAQAGVALHQGVEGELQRRHVQLAGEAEEHRHVVQVRTFLVLLDEPQATLRRGQRPDRRAAGLDGCGEGPLCLQATDDGIAMLANLLAKGRCQRLLARLRDELPLIVERKLHPLLGQLLQQADDIGVHLLPLRP